MTDTSAGLPPQGDGPYVITLCSTSVPMMLQLPLLSVFAGLTVFRSRVVEEGRERFRMHLGYFYDQERAARVLVAARRFYPGAFLAEAPQSGMGSLDDTMNTAFRFAKGPAARLVPAERMPAAEEFAGAAARAGAAAEPVYDDSVGAEAAGARAEAAAAADRARADITAAGSAVVTGAAGPAEPARAPVVLEAGETGEAAEPAYETEIAEACEAAEVAEDEPESADSFAARAAAFDATLEAALNAPSPEATPVAPESVQTTVAIDPSTAVLDVATPAVAQDDPPQSARPRERAAFAVQRYAVQLRWSTRPVEPGAIPHHALFKQFTLYGVTVQRGESTEHGLRLGFFSNLYSAKQVADYVRHDFPYASVVPISEREMVRAQQAAWNELLVRVGVQSRATPPQAATTDEGAQKSVRRDFGLRRLWGRQS